MISRVTDGLAALTGINWSQRNFQFHTNQLSSNLTAKIFFKKERTFKIMYFFYFLKSSKRYFQLLQLSRKRYSLSCIKACRWSIPWVVKKLLELLHSFIPVFMFFILKQYYLKNFLLLLLLQIHLTLRDPIYV